MVLAHEIRESSFQMELYYGPCGEERKEGKGDSKTVHSFNQSRRFGKSGPVKHSQEVDKKAWAETQCQKFLVDLQGGLPVYIDDNDNGCRYYNMGRSIVLHA